jgi:hypothetical protein
VISLYCIYVEEFVPRLYGLCRAWTYERLSLGNSLFLIEIKGDFTWQDSEDPVWHWYTHNDIRTLINLFSVI